MKKLVLIALAVMTLTVTVSSSGHAYRGWYGGWYGGRYWHGGNIGIDIAVGPGWGPYYPSYPPRPYYPYYTAPAVVEQQPETYIQQYEPAEEQVYWYFCKDPNGYYPYIKRCPSGWTKVVPPQTPQDRKE